MKYDAHSIHFCDYKKRSSLVALKDRVVLEDDIYKKLLRAFRIFALILGANLLNAYTSAFHYIVGIL